MVKAIESGALPSLENAAVIAAPFATYAAVSLLEPTIDQYKSYTFATVKQSTTRKIGRGLVEKLFSLDHRFHTNRETGALLKVIISSSFRLSIFLIKAVDRGNRAISTVLHATCIVFTPAMFQVMCTGAFIWYFCGPLYATSLLVSSGIYSAFSIKFTQV